VLVCICQREEVSSEKEGGREGRERERGGGKEGREKGRQRSV